MTLNSSDVTIFPLKSNLSLNLCSFIICSLSTGPIFSPLLIHRHSLLWSKSSILWTIWALVLVDVNWQQLHLPLELPLFLSFFFVFFFPCPYSIHPFSPNCMPTSTQKSLVNSSALHDHSLPHTSVLPACKFSLLYFRDFYVFFPQMDYRPSLKRIWVCDKVNVWYFVF